jgi:hypothetical protein
VVRKFLLWLALKTGKNASPNTASFCKARARLPQKGLETIHRRLTNEIEAQIADNGLWRQRRVKIVDGTGLSMPDTKANQKIYPQSQRQKPGCGFPVMKLVVAFSLATGAIIGFVKGTLHDANQETSSWLIPLFAAMPIFISCPKETSTASWPTIRGAPRVSNSSNPSERKIGCFIG